MTSSDPVEKIVDQKSIKQIKKLDIRTNVREPKIEGVKGIVELEDYFFVKGWYVSDTEQDVRITFNGRPQQIKEIDMWADVTEKFADYPVKKAFKAVVAREQLQETVHVRVTVAGRVRWEKKLTLKDKT